MLFHIPFHFKIARNIDPDIDHIWYNASSDYPGLCGGRYKKRVKYSLLSSESTFKLSEQYGPRFVFLANSTFPVLDDRSRELFRHLSRHGSPVTVAKMDFAEQLKEEFPDLKLQASCVMSLYTPFLEVLESKLFECVCPPQFWNYDIEKMIENVPVEHRHRVHYILNSRCFWEPRCRLHYEDMSLSYTGNRFKFKTTHGPPLDAGAQSLAYRGRLVFEALSKSGFSAFKIQGREEKPAKVFAALYRIIGRWEVSEEAKKVTMIPEKRDLPLAVADKKI